MNRNSGDRRVRKTKTALREGLSRLMQQKSIHDITVRELTDLVDINRATFYLHYRDIHDLLRQIEDEMIVEIGDILTARQPAAGEDARYPLLVALLQYIADHRGLCGLFFSQNSGRSFPDKLCAVVEQRCLKSWLGAYASPNADRIGYFSSYVVGGYVAVIAQWVQAGMPVPPHVLADVLGDMGKYGAGCLEPRTEGWGRP